MEAGMTAQAAWMPEPAEPPPATAPAPGKPAHARLRSWLLHCECLAGPPEAERKPFGLAPAAPLLPRASARLLAPADGLVAWSARRLLAAGPHASRQSAEQGAESGGESGEAEHTGHEGQQQQQRRQDVEFRCRLVLQISFVTVAALALILAYWAQNFAASFDLGEPLNMQCHLYFTKYATEFGASKCGLNGRECDPGGWFAVRCAGFCAEKQITPLAIPVIGDGPYRADSRVCMAAAHAGLIGEGGGCVEARIGGPASSFTGSTRNGVTSLPFDSWYPVTLELRACSSGKFCSFEAWWAVLLLNVILLFLLSLLRPGRRLYFWSLLTALYWYVALAAGVGPTSVEDAFAKMGSYFFFTVSSYVLLWRIGGAKLFFPDTAAGAPFDVLLFELLPALPMLHMSLIALFTGDYDVNSSLFQDWRPLVLYGSGMLVILPVVCVLMKQWYKAKCLRWLLSVLFCGALGIVILSLIFSTADWGPHLHHYFLALVGYLFARGPSRTAAVFRAFCLGAFVNGLCRWGRPLDIPIWGPGGWLPDEGEVDADARAASRAAAVIWTAATLGAGGREVSLSWALYGELLPNCTNDTDLPEEMVNLDAPLYVVEMNHVEVYRGWDTSWTFSLPPDVVERNESGRVYFRVGTVARGYYSGALSASHILALRPAWPPAEVYYRPPADACERSAALQHQPPWTLDGYI